MKIPSKRRGPEIDILDGEGVEKVVLDGVKCIIIDHNQRTVMALSAGRVFRILQEKHQGRGDGEDIADDYSRFYAERWLNKAYHLAGEGYEVNACLDFISLQ